MLMKRVFIQTFLVCHKKKTNDKHLGMIVLTDVSQVNLKQCETGQPISAWDSRLNTGAERSPAFQTPDKQPFPGCRTAVSSANPNKDGRAGIRVDGTAVALYAYPVMKALIPFFVVGAGGFAGSVMRYALSLLGQRFSVTFPHGTLWANLLGCLAIGSLTALAARTEVLSPTLRLLLATGLCGGFTTMSTFAYEMFRFTQATEYLYASGYFLLTVVGCATTFFLGMLAVNLMVKG